MKQIFTVLLVAISLNISAQNNIYMVSELIVEIENNLNLIIKEYPTSEISLKEEITRITNSPTFTDALFTGNFWDYHETNTYAIIKMCKLIIDSDNTSRSTTMALLKRNLNKTSTEDKGSILNSIPFEAVIIQGITNFVAKRFKQEIELAFFKRFRDFMKNNTSMGELYPRTVQIFQYDNFMGIEQLTSSLRAAFNEDLQNLPTNLVKAIENPEPTGWFKNTTANKDVRAFFLLGNKYISNLEKDKDPKASLKLIINENIPQAKNILNVINIYMTELESRTEYASALDFDAKTNDVFSALMYNKYKLQNFKQNISEADKLEYIRTANEFVKKLNDFNDAFLKYNKSKADKEVFGVQDYVNYLSVYSNLFTASDSLLTYNNASEFTNLRGVKFHLKDTTKSIAGKEVLKLSNQLIQNLIEMKVTAKAGNFSLLVNNSNFILSNIYDGKEDAKDTTEKSVKNLMKYSQKYFITVHSFQNFVQVKQIKKFLICWINLLCQQVVIL